MNCPGFQQLVDYVDGHLPKGATAPVTSHIATGCRDCTETVKWYRLVRATTALDELVTPPRWVVNRAFKIFDQKAHRGNIAQRVARGVAALVFDSLARPALVGVRSTETSSRQLLFKSGDYSLDMQITQAAAGSDVIGQVLSERDPRFDSVAGLKVELVRANDPPLGALTDDMGEFRISGVAGGRYDLRIELPEGTIRVPDLPIGEY